MAPRPLDVLPSIFTHHDELRRALPRLASRHGLSAGDKGLLAVAASIPILTPAEFCARHGGLWTSAVIRVTPFPPETPF